MKNKTSIEILNQDIIVRILELPAIKSNWPQVYDFIKDFMVSVEIGESEYTKLLIVTEEIFVNVSSYAYPTKSGDINIRVEYDKLSNVIRMTFKDSGIPFDPTKVIKPNLKASPKERKIGGLGIYLVSKMSDNMEYSYIDNQNVLSITKILKSKELDKLEFEKTRERNKVTYKIVGRLDTQTSPDFQDEIDKAFEETAQAYDNKMELILDFSQVEYLSSAGLRTVLYIKKRIDLMEGSSLKIINVLPTVMEVFSMTGFTEFLNLDS